MDAKRVNETWWRIELDNGGKLLKCERVKKGGRSTAHVLFVLANTKAQACNDAAQWYERQREQARRWQKATYYKRKGEGICRSCSEPLAASSETFCETHLRAAREYARTYYQEGPRPRPATDVEAAQRNALAAARRWRRMNILLSYVLERFDQLDGRLDSPFRAWLIAELYERSDSKQAQAAE